MGGIDKEEAAATRKRVYDVSRGFMAGLYYI